MFGDKIVLYSRCV